MANSTRSRSWAHGDFEEELGLLAGPALTLKLTSWLAGTHGHGLFGLFIQQSEIPSPDKFYRGFAFLLAPIADHHGRRELSPTPA